MVLQNERMSIRAWTFHDDELLGVVFVDDDEREVPFELLVGRLDGLGEIAVVMLLDEVHHDLGVGLGVEDVALLLE